MIKVKKIRNIIVGGTLATMLGASGLTAVFASTVKLILQLVHMDIMVKIMIIRLLQKNQLQNL